MAAQGSELMGRIREFPQRSAQPPPSAPDGGNGNGKDLHGRVSALEAQLQYLATKEDIRRIETLIQRIETQIAECEAAMVRWLIGLVVAAALALGVALIRLFVS